MEIISIMLLSYPLSALVGITTIRKAVKILADNGYKISDGKESDNTAENSFKIEPLYIPVINVAYVSIYANVYIM